MGDLPRRRYALASGLIRQPAAAPPRGDVQLALAAGPVGQRPVHLQHALLASPPARSAGRRLLFGCFFGGDPVRVAFFYACAASAVRRPLRRRRRGRTDPRGLVGHPEHVDCVVVKAMCAQPVLGSIVSMLKSSRLRFEVGATQKYSQVADVTDVHGRRGHLRPGEGGLRRAQREVDRLPGVQVPARQADG